MSTTQTPRDIREWIALTLSTAIVVSAVVYWVIQISGVMDMLKLAHG